MRTLDKTDFEFDEKTGTITKYLGAEKDVVIPSEIDGIKVVHIGGEAFWNKALVSVVFPSSIISIGKSAFAGNQLASVVIGDNVTNIENRAFNCNNLTSVTIEGVKERFNNNWENIGFPYEYMPEIINENGFLFYEGEIKRYIGSETNIEISNEINGITVTSIGCWAFANNALVSVTIPNSVTIIRKGAFSDNNLRSITIPDSVTEIEDWAFIDNNLTSITIEYNSINPKGRFDYQIGIDFDNVTTDKVIYVSKE